MSTTAIATIQPPLVRSLTTATLPHTTTNSFTFTASSPSTNGRRLIAVNASRSTKQETKPDTSQDYDNDDDVRFLLKLGVGSFAGAAAIKYGSVLVPEITRPNIIQALIMISTPVLVAVFILIKQSRVKH